MATRSVSVDWDGAVPDAARGRQLLEYMTAHLPRDQWAQARDSYGATLLHVAAAAGDERAAVALVLCGAPVDACDQLRRTPLREAAAAGHAGCVRVLLASGASLHACAPGEPTALDRAVINLRDSCTRLLLANGARLDDVMQDRWSCVRLWMVDTVHARWKCRAAVIALLALKRRHAHQLQHWDRFLVREVCVQLWASRQDIKGWSGEK